MILQEHQMLPLHINIKGKSAVIAGGGEIAARRLKTVLAEGASATVISPEASEEMLGLIKEHGIEWKKKKRNPAISRMHF